MPKKQQRHMLSSRSGSRSGNQLSYRTNKTAADKEIVSGSVDDMPLRCRSIAKASIPTTAVSPKEKKVKLKENANSNRPKLASLPASALQRIRRMKHNKDQ